MVEIKDLRHILEIEFEYGELNALAERVRFILQALG